MILPKRTSCLFGRCQLSYLLDDLNLAIKSRSPTLNQGHVGREAHPVHMPPGIKIIQGIENNVERPEPVDIELAIFDICMIRLKFGVGLELMRDLFGYLFSPPRMSDYLRRKL